MTASAKTGFFARAVTAVALLGPIVLVVVAGTLPIGERGELIVGGHIFLVALLVTALVLRAAYDLGFERALKLIASPPGRSLTA